LSQYTVDSTASGTGIVQTLTGNTGGAVGPTGGNINVIGEGNITVTGDPGTSTLTISAGQSVFLQIDSYVIQPTDRIISFLANPPITITLPLADANIGRCITIKAISGSHPITISNGSDAISGDGAFAGSYIIDTDGGAIDIWAVEPSTTSPTGTGIWVVT
jgi:hypothetical protein